MRFGYDGNGNLVTVTSPGGVVDTVTVDSTNEITGVTTATGTTTDASFGYTLTASGRQATSTDALAGTSKQPVSYTRLEQTATVGGGGFGYDAADNLTATPDGTTFAYDPAGQLTARTVPNGAPTSYAYDAVGQRTGTTTGAAVTTLAYNQAGQLTSFAGVDVTETFTYNGDGERSRTTVTGSSPAAQVWDHALADRPLLLDDGTSDYLYGPIGQPVEQIDHASGAATFLHSDRIGSVRTLTDVSGAVVGTATFDTYGAVTHASGLRSPFGFAGAYTDPTGLIYLMARYYDPATGQFLTVDPLVDRTGSPYAYASNDPLNRVDPLGLWSWRSALATGLGAVSTVTGAIAVGLAVTGVGAPAAAVLETVSVGTGVGAAVLDCTAHWDVQCGVDIAAAALGGAGGVLRWGSRFTRVAEAGDMADLVFGVNSVALGFVGTVLGINGGIHERAGSGALATSAYQRMLASARLRCLPGTGSIRHA